MRDYKPPSNKRYSKDRGARRALMYDAVCDQCGRKCKVPFKPTGDKPVYCSDCFEQQSGRRTGRRDHRRYDERERRMYTATCDECGKECQVPFKPTSGKPIFCDSCFSAMSKKRTDKGADSGQLQEQMDLVNSKLDRIIQILESLTVAGKEPKKKSSAKKTVSKKKRAKKAASKKGKAKVRKTTKKKAKKTAKKKSSK
jgi:CxxC-x17-CxxC domain-containing protein